MNNLQSLKWVKLKRFCELTGETRDSLKRKRLGFQSKTNPIAPIWIEGIHWIMAGDSQIRYNVEEYEKWVENSKERLHAG